MAILSFIIIFNYLIACLSASLNATTWTLPLPLYMTKFTVCSTTDHKETRPHWQSSIPNLFFAILKKKKAQILESSNNSFALCGSNFRELLSHVIEIMLENVKNVEKL